MTYLQNKKRAFISMIANLSNKIKRLVSGGTSVTLSDCYDGQSLVLLQFQGASGGSGDLTSNLLNLNDFVDGYFINASGSKVASNEYHYSNPITLDSGTYTLFCTNGMTVSTNVIVHKYDSNGNWISQITTKAFSSGQTNTLIFTVASDTNTVISIGKAYYNVCLVKGSYTVDTIPKEPYGYQIGVLCDSSILASTDTIDKSSYNASGNVITASTYSRTDICNAKPSTSYTVKCDVKTDGMSVYLLQWHDDTLLKRASIGTLTTSNPYKTFTTEATTNKIAFFFTRLKENYTYVVCYESYKTPICLPCYIGANQLNSLNGHTDKAIMDFENKTSKNVKNTITRTFNGTESWTTTGDTSAGVYQGFAVASATYNVAKPTSGKYQTICDVFPYSATNVANTSRIEAGNYGLRLIIGADRVPSLTKADFITWLKANPITITYPCATEYEENTTDLNTTTLNTEATTHEGTTVIVDGSTNKVSGMDVEYYASK